MDRRPLKGCEKEEAPDSACEVLVTEEEAGHVLRRGQARRLRGDAPPQLRLNSPKRPLLRNLPPLHRRTPKVYQNVILDCT
jgi:hypothetical protein